MTLGQSIHDLETRLDRARHQEDGGLEIIDELETALDQTRQTLDNLANPQAAQPAEPVEAVAPELPLVAPVEEEVAVGAADGDQGPAATLRRRRRARTVRGRGRGELGFAGV